MYKVRCTTFEQPKKQENKCNYRSDWSAKLTWDRVRVVAVVYGELQFDIRHLRGNFSERLYHRQQTVKHTHNWVRGSQIPSERTRRSTKMSQEPSLWKMSWVYEKCIVCQRFKIWCWFRIRHQKSSTVSKLVSYRPKTFEISVRSWFGARVFMVVIYG